MTIEDLMTTNTHEHKFPDLQTHLVESDPSVMRTSSHSEEASHTYFAIVQLEVTGHGYPEED